MFSTYSILAMSLEVSKRKELTLFLSFYRHDHLSRGSCKAILHQDIPGIKFLRLDQRVRIRCRIVKSKEGRIKRVVSVLIRGSTDLPLIMNTVKETVGNEAGHLIAGQLTDGDERQSWISPWALLFSDVFQQLKQARRQLETVKNNGGSPSTVRFYEKRERIARGNLLIDCGLADIDDEELLLSEIQNFKKGFPVEF